MMSGSGRATSSRVEPALVAGRQLAAIKYQSQDSQPQGAHTPAAADQAEGALQSAPHTAAGILEGQRGHPAAFRHCVNLQSLSDVHGNLCLTPQHPACQVTRACPSGLGRGESSCWPSSALDTLDAAPSRSSTLTEHPYTCPRTNVGLFAPPSAPGCWPPGVVADDAASGQSFLLRTYLQETHA